jgi:hypothetical protein
VVRGSSVSDAKKEQKKVEREERIKIEEKVRKKRGRGKSRFEIKRYQKTESYYLISIDGEKVKLPILSTDIMDNITPNPSGILASYLLLRKCYL